MATLQEYREDRPHWSFSSLNQFINICSLQWALQRLYKVTSAFTPFTLSFGSAFHRVMESVALQRKEGKTPIKKESSDLFHDLWTRQLAEDKNIRFDEDITPEDCAQQGRDMVSCLVDNLDPQERILQVNQTFAVPVVDAQGLVLETPLIGEIDFVAAQDGKVILGDWKTSGRRWPKNKADLDLQATVSIYAYKQTYGELPPFKFTVVVKNKTPVIENHITERNQDQFHRLAELIKMVESMIKAEHFLPNEHGFYCSGCQFQAACKTWHKNRNKLISIAA